MALRACRGTLARLSAGACPFYDAADLMQDLFLAFWELSRRLPEDALWPAWERTLYMGAAHIVRRRPQRLWQRRERAVDPRRLLMDGGLPLPPTPALTEEDAGEAGALAAATVDEVEAGLWQLRPAERQVIYLLALRGLPREEAARRLRLPSGTAAASRLRRARRHLRCALARAGRGGFAERRLAGRVRRPGSRGRSRP